MDSKGRNGFAFAVVAAAVSLYIFSGVLPRGADTLSAGNIVIAVIVCVVLRFTVWAGAK